MVSAIRTIEGLRYIQSDVSITHGSSGGALLDENGSVIGITVSRVEQDGSTGINFFIPIDDALKTLSLTAPPPASGPTPSQVAAPPPEPKYATPAAMLETWGA